jgi:hypothetical protein
MIWQLDENEILKNFTVRKRVESRQCHFMGCRFIFHDVESSGGTPGAARKRYLLYAPSIVVSRQDYSDFSSVYLAP